MCDDVNLHRNPSRLVLREDYTLANWQINMEHNSGGLEDEFLGQRGDF